jgi:hypothetical protein
MMDRNEDSPCISRKVEEVSGTMPCFDDISIK